LQESTVKHTSSQIARLLHIARTRSQEKRPGAKHSCNLVDYRQLKGTRFAVMLASPDADSAHDENEMETEA